MSVQRRKIEAAVKAQGYVIESIEWQPIGGMVEKMGRDGGWTVFASNGTREVMACGYNADDVVAFIVEFWKPKSATRGGP